MPDMYFSFIDLLGFRQLVKNDQMGAAYLLANCTEILRFKSGMDPTSINSFRYLIPFSDSLFFAADDPNTFLFQLSNFLSESYLFTGREIAGTKFENPYSQEIVNLKIGSNGNVIREEIRENYYPPLFRGGISFGNINSVLGVGFNNFNTFDIPILTGGAVIDAISTEENKIKGPRILIPVSLYERLDDSGKSLCGPFPKSFSDNFLNDFFSFENLKYRNYYELLWPIVSFDRGNGELDLWKIDEYFLSALKLKYFYRNSTLRLHYLNFLYLIVFSALKHFKSVNLYNEAIEKFKSLRRNSNIEFDLDRAIRYFDDIY